MNYQKIRKMQRECGLDEIQNMIFSGQVWMMEGSMGRYAMELLKSGSCMLGTEPSRDYYGNRIPSRYEVKAGTTGSFKNTVQYWQNQI